jgi:hypothetical protein
MKTLLYVISALLLIASGFIPRGSSGADFKNTHGMQACTSSEKWKFSTDVPENIQADFKSFLGKKTKSVHAFSEALATRRFAKTDEAKLFSEYWISRSLFDGELPHIAFEGFRSLASRPVTAENVGILTAALDCLTEIHKAHPSLALPSDVAARLPEFWALAKFQGANEVVWEATGAVIRTLVSLEQPPTGAALELMTLLKGSGAHEQLAKGIWAAKNNQHSQTVAELEKFLANQSIPDYLVRFKDTVHLLVARAYYSTERFDMSNGHLKQITKASNELAASLSELSWAYLMNERYGEAIGTSVNLEAGRMRSTFAPEGPMVMAMALNELCQYPESIGAINLFKKRYEKPFRWLASWNREEPLYPMAIAFLRRQGNVPDRIAGEWVRSPLFISSQDEINILFQEQKSTSSLAKIAYSEQVKLANEIIQKARALKPLLKKAKAEKKKNGKEMSRDIASDLDYIRRQVSHLRRLQSAAPVWKIVLNNYHKQVPGLVSKLMARINGDLKQRSVRMLAQLEEIVENTQLIEVEIYNGASQDIIWQNAHPDYKELAQKMKNDRQIASKEKVYDWGKISVGSDEEEEIWEDELGSFKSNLYDNCNSKDKYLAIKKIQMAGN